MCVSEFVAHRINIRKSRATKPPHRLSNPFSFSTFLGRPSAIAHAVNLSGRCDSMSYRLSHPSLYCSREAKFLLDLLTDHEGRRRSTDSDGFRADHRRLFTAERHTDRHGHRRVRRRRLSRARLEDALRAVVATELTYHNRISRIVQQHCIECHREGGVAPFALDTYEDLVAHAGMVEQVVERGIMPPWFAAQAKPDGETGEVYTPWANDRSLAEAEKQELLAWIAGGKPEGDRRDAPQPRQFVEDWLIGEPDAVFQFSEPVPVKVTGVMPYQYVTVETNPPEDQWVQAIEVQPGERGVYVPGNSTLVYPDGFAKRLPKAAKLRFQMHYTPNGTATTDRTRIGLIWAKQPQQHEVRVAGIVNTRIRIPPGADNHRSACRGIPSADTRRRRSPARGSPSADKYSRTAA